MTAERREVVFAFEKAKLPRRAIPQVDKNVESPTASEADLSLSISADSGIVSIPLVILTSMWNKAYELLSTENAITPVPVTLRQEWFSLVLKMYHTMYAVALMANICVIKTAFSGCRVKSALTH